MLIPQPLYIRDLSCSATMKLYWTTNQKVQQMDDQTKLCLKKSIYSKYVDCAILVTKIASLFKKTSKLLHSPTKKDLGSLIVVNNCNVCMISMMNLYDLQGLNCNLCMHPWWSCMISRDSTAQCMYASMMKLCDLQGLNCNLCMLPWFPWWSCVISRDSTAQCMYASIMKLC